jgi:hypothetical protein
MEFGPSLLGLEANGHRYWIARSEGSAAPGFGRGLYLVEGDAGGEVIGASPLDDLSGQSTQPFDYWIAAGLAPHRTNKVEIEATHGLQRGRSRSGMWIAAIPIVDRYISFTVRFLDATGAVVETREGDAFIPRPRRVGSRNT